MIEWRAVADALFLAETDRERRIAERMYRTALRERLFSAEQAPQLAELMDSGAQGTFTAPGPVAENGELRHVPGASGVVFQPSGHPQPPVEGQLRSTADGSGVEQFRAGLWQDVDPVDLFRHKAQTAGRPVPVPTLMPPLAAVPDPETVERRAALRAERLAGRGSTPPPVDTGGTATGPAEPPGQDPGLLVPAATPPESIKLQAVSGGNVKAQPSGVMPCAAPTPTGPCQLPHGHPPDAGLPSHGGHMGPPATENGS